MTHDVAPDRRGEGGPDRAETGPADLAPRCPFCNSDDTQLISLFGSQAILAQHRCRACGTPFETMKY